MPLIQRKQGNFIQADFFDNSAGINTTDSPFRVLENQATDGYNYDYVSTGGFQKRYGHGLLSAAPDSKVRALGYFLFATSANVKTLLRAAGTALETQSTTTGACTVQSDDSSSPISSIFTSNQPVVFTQFNTTTTNTSWCAGGGLASSRILGYNGTKTTINGAAVPAGSISTSATGSDGTIPAGNYFYAVALHKLSTGAISNATLDKVVTVGSTNHVVLDLSGITGTDSTKYDLFYIYRSAISGVTGFTTGDLAGTVASSATSFTDTGTTQGTAQPVPRAGSASLDNSVLGAGTYKTITTWKRRLVTAQGSTICIADLNKPESWPIGNTITIPSGGDITALGIISFNTSTTTGTDEFLAVFKERELWMLTGTSSSDWVLKFVDYIGCATQPLLTGANGFLSWVDYRGVYLWDGSGKPIYCSRPIEADFKSIGDIDLTNLTLGWGVFSRTQNQLLWFLSSKSLGTQKLVIKMDVRLTYPAISNALDGRILEGVFIKDSNPYPLYAGYSALPNSSEMLYAGDDIGNTYTLFTDLNADNTNAGQYWDVATWNSSSWDYLYAQTAGQAFRYRTKALDLGLIGTTKRFHKIIVWAKQNSTANLTLNYWVNYLLDPAHQATQIQPLNSSTSFASNAFWDQGFWDRSYWDLFTLTYGPIVFNLSNSSVGVEGDALTLEFVQSGANAPVSIAGYSIIYTETGLRK